MVGVTIVCVCDCVPELPESYQNASVAADFVDVVTYETERVNMFSLNFTKRQWLTLAVIGLADFCNAICVSLQAPFFPQEVRESM